MKYKNFVADSDPTSKDLLMSNSGKGNLSLFGLSHNKASRTATFNNDDTNKSTISPVKMSNNSLNTSPDK